MFYNGLKCGGGSIDLPSLTSGTATASDISDGKTAWVNGEKINGKLKSMGNGTFIRTQNINRSSLNLEEITDSDFGTITIISKKSIYVTSAKLNWKFSDMFRFIGVICNNSIKANKSVCIPVNDCDGKYVDLHKYCNQPLTEPDKAMFAPFSNNARLFKLDTSKEPISETQYQFIIKAFIAIVASKNDVLSLYNNQNDPLISYNIVF